MKGIRIRPEQTGLRATLFDLEADVMDLVWTNRWTQFSVGEVHEALGRRRAIAYTTVMTTVSRLFDKGLLTRRRDGRRYDYSPKLTREEFTRTMAREVLDSLGTSDRQTALALLVDRVAEADGAELDRLAELIARKRRKARS